MSELSELSRREVIMVKTPPLSPPIVVPEDTFPRLNKVCELHAALDSTKDEVSKLKAEIENLAPEILNLNICVMQLEEHVPPSNTVDVDMAKLFQWATAKTLRVLSTAYSDILRERLLKLEASISSIEMQLQDGYTALCSYLDFQIHIGKLPIGSFDNIYKHYSLGLLAIAEFQQKRSRVEELNVRMKELPNEIEAKAKLDIF